MTDATAEFERHRARLERVAYNMLSSRAEAEDVVQEAWLRWERADRDEIRDPGAWLTTVVGRLALDALGSARVRREQYVGSWLPEPLVADPASDPADRVTLDETVSMAMLVVLDRLSPAQRTAFVLHDVFGVPFDEIGEIVGRTPEATRKLASRARREVRTERTGTTVDRAEQERVVAAFTVAASGGGMDELIALLDPDVVWSSDGGGHVAAVRKPLHGAERVAKAILGFSRMGVLGAYLADVNGEPGLVMRDANAVLTVMAFAIEGGRITAIHTVRNPEKLRGVPSPG
ncbi:MAG: RNA polymerase sigma factor SigJ [Solirubrobacteraceae bacterium]|nr:RNA polymerase sigma factor SigJ [Solirubrobacteraceae bacterium]